MFHRLYINLVCHGIVFIILQLIIIKKKTANKNKHIKCTLLYVFRLYVIFSILNTVQAAFFALLQEMSMCLSPSPDLLDELEKFIKEYASLPSLSFILL